MIKKLFSMFLLPLLFIGCGGGDPATPADSCNGTPTAAVVFVGAPVTTIKNACTTYVEATDLASLRAAAVDVTTKAGQSRVYLVGAGKGAYLVLQYKITYLGTVDVISMWGDIFGMDVTPIKGSITSLHFNGDCAVMAAQIRDQGVPAVCHPSAAYDAAAAVNQLGL